jgi:tetratricopeptide (TPR) repeat protein
MAGKVSSELQTIIRKRPQLFADLISALKDQPDRVGPPDCSGGPRWQLVTNGARLVQEQKKLVKVAASEARNLTESAAGDSVHKEIAEKEPGASQNRDALNRARREVQKKRYEAALADYTEAIRRKPDSAEAYYGRGNAYLKQTLLAPALRGFDGQKLESVHETAISDFTEAIRLKPNFAETYARRGSAYWRQEQNSGALADFNEAIRLNPQSEWAWNGRGSVYLDQNQYEKAVADYSEAIRLEPNKTESYSCRAVAYQKLGQTAKAKQDWAKIEHLQKLGFH